MIFLMLMTTFICRDILENNKYIQALPSDAGIIYNMNILKSLWFSVGPHAREDGTANTFYFHPDGQSMDIVNWDNLPRANLPFNTLVGTIHKKLAELEAEVKTFCRMLHFPDDVYNDFADIAAKLVDDHNLSQSIFAQPLNKHLMRPILDRTRNGLPQTFKEEAWKTLICQSKKCQDLCIAVFALTAGISPRAFQFHSFHMSSLMGSKKNGKKSRSLFIIDGIPVLANPAAKQRDQPIFATIFGIFKEFRTVFLFRLSVMRMAEVHILTAVGYECKLLEDYVFLSFPTSSNKHAFTPIPSRDIKRSIALHLDELPGVPTTRFLRSLQQAIFREFAATLLQRAAIPAGNVVDQVAQHTQKTGTQSYGKLNNRAPKALGIGMEEATRLLDVSLVQHALLGLDKVPERCYEHLQKTHLAPTIHHQSFALLSARHAVTHKYRIWELQEDADALQKLVLKTRYFPANVHEVSNTRVRHI